MKIIKRQQYTAIYHLTTDLQVFEMLREVSKFSSIVQLINALNLQALPIAELFNVGNNSIVSRTWRLNEHSVV